MNDRKKKAHLIVDILSIAAGYSCYDTVMSSMSGECSLFVGFGRMVLSATAGILGGAFVSSILDGVVEDLIEDDKDEEVVDA